MEKECNKIFVFSAFLIIIIIIYPWTWINNPSVHGFGSKFNSSLFVNFNKKLKKVDFLQVNLSFLFKSSS